MWIIPAVRLVTCPEGNDFTVLIEYAVLYLSVVGRGNAHRTGIVISVLTGTHVIAMNHIDQAMRPSLPPGQECVPPPAQQGNPDTDAEDADVLSLLAPHPLVENALQAEGGSQGEGPHSDSAEVDGESTGRDDFPANSLVARRRFQSRGEPNREVHEGVQDVMTALHKGQGLTVDCSSQLSRASWERVVSDQPTEDTPDTEMVQLFSSSSKKGQKKEAIACASENGQYLSSLPHKSPRRDEITTLSPGGNEPADMDRATALLTESNPHPGWRRPIAWDGTPSRYKRAV
ncbi:unnamed protein product [Leuciscus chuanchicus]